MLLEHEIHNQFKESVHRFKTHDPHLRKLSQYPLVYSSPLLQEKSFHTPGVYLITGGRQIGKTTFLKQFILQLLSAGIPSTNIQFLTGEIIDSHHILRQLITRFIDQTNKYNSQTSRSPQMTADLYLFIDEINYVPDWDKSIKFLIDSSILDHTSVILTGSDSQIIYTAMKRFAGRRGKSSQTDFILSPLNFLETIRLKQKALIPHCQKIIATPLLSELPGYLDFHPQLTDFFYEYLLHGGYLPAINDYALNGNISPATFNTYIHWIIGDILKYNKSEHYLKEILQGILTTYSTPVSWNSMSRFLSIEHHATISDYCNILSSIHVLHILQALQEHKLTGAPKKNKKLYFRDPFIHHAVAAYLGQENAAATIQEKLRNNEIASKFVEAVCIDHCKRRLPTYYIKGQKGEVDVALIKDRTILPIEIKWTKRLRTEELKQILEYDGGLILTPSPQIRKQGKCTVLPLVRFLVHVCGEIIKI